MKKVNLLSRADMRKVLGGVAEVGTDLCEGKTGLALKECRYGVCMDGWDSSAHTTQENRDKLDSCYGLSGLPS